MEENKVFKGILEWSLCILIALVVALLTRYYIGTSTVVKNTSMHPTLQEKQRVYLNRIKRITKGEYKVGDIVTFEAPSRIPKSSEIDLENPVAVYNYEPESLSDKFIYYILELNKTSYIKRIIGVEGDRIQIINGKVYVNGRLINEEYLQKGTITKSVYYNDIIVPKGYVYVMGDNRNESLDSRIFGCIPLEKVEGKVVFRYWPFNEFGKI